MSTQEDRLRAFFRADQLSAFKEDDLFGEWRQASFISRVMPAPPLGDLAGIAGQPKLKPYFEDIDSYLKKFSFGEVNLEHWNGRYLFPRPSSVRAFCRKPENGNPHPLSIVNRSFDAVESWVVDELIPGVKDGREKINVLIGGVGAGKSTFNKYVTSRFFQTFKDHKITTTRIEYFKLYKFVSKHYVPQRNPDQPHRSLLLSLIQKFTFCCILRDLFHYGWSRPLPMQSGLDSSRTFQPLQECSWPELDVYKSNSSNEFQAFINDRRPPTPEGASINIDAATVIKEVKAGILIFKSPDLKSRARWFQEILSDSSRQAALEYFARYASHLGLKTFVIFDGLDYVQISDFIDHTSHRAILSGIADWLIEEKGKVNLPYTHSYIYPTYQVTMRTNTYALFWLNFSQAIHETQGPIYYIVPPEFKDIFMGISKARLWSDESGITKVEKTELLSIFNQIQASLASRIEISQRKISKLFMNNTRYRIHFARNILEELLKSTFHFLDSKKLEHSHVNILNQLKVEAQNLIDSGRNYRFVDILLHSKNDRFANFVRIEGDLIDLDRHKNDHTYLESCLRDNNFLSGYIGNIFNYHIPYKSKSDCQFFLEKLRILDILVNSYGEALPESEIRMQFARNGWEPSSYFKFSIGIMIRENIITGYSIEAGSSGYIPTELGHIIRYKLVKNMIYLEQIYFGCFLPFGIKRRSIDVYRNVAQRHEWVAASIFHCWLILKLVRTAEDGGGKSFFEEIRVSISETVDRILSAKSLDQRITIFALRRIERFILDMDQ